MLSFSKLPSRILQEVKGKMLSTQNKFSKSSHSIWTQCAKFFVRTFDLDAHVEEHLLKLLAQRSK